MSTARRKGPTIRDVVTASGYSQTTVSNALSGKGRLSAEVRAEVAKVAEEIGYRPNPTAQALRTSTTRAIALVLPHAVSATALPSAGFYMRMISAAATEAFRHGRLLLLSPRPESVEAATALHVDSAIVADPAGAEDHVGYLRAAGVAVVTYERDRFGSAPAAVVSTNVANTEALLGELHEGGGTDFLLVVPPSSVPSLEDIRSTFEAWVADHCLPGTVVTAAPDDPEAVAHALRSRASIDAVLDLVHPVALDALRGLGRSVPDDVVLATYADTGDLEYADPPVTAIDLQPELIGQEVVAALIRSEADAGAHQLPTSPVPGILRARASSRRPRA